MSELEVITIEKMNNKIYNLPAWKQCEGCDSIESMLKLPMGITYGYVIERYHDNLYSVFTFYEKGDTEDHHLISDCSTLDDAKTVAMGHFNQLIQQLRNVLTNVL